MDFMMDDDGFRTMRNVVTGLTGRYPAHFEGQFNLVLAEDDDEECLTCRVQDLDDDQEYTEDLDDIAPSEPDEED
jgi:hypothetical protein